MPKKPLKAVIFDLDGTLVDSAPDLLTALNSVLVAEGLSPLSLEDMHSVAGDGIRPMLRRGFGKNGKEVDGEHIAALVEPFLDYYRRHLVEHSRLYPGAKRLLAELRGKGIKIAVCTNKMEELAVEVVERLHIKLDAVVGVVDSEIKKPNPLHLQRALDAVGVAADQAVMVGDNSKDIDAAKPLNVPTIAAAYGYGAERMADFADVRVQNLAELPAALARLGWVI